MLTVKQWITELKNGDALDHSQLTIDAGTLAEILLQWDSRARPADNGQLPETTGPTEPAATAGEPPSSGDAAKVVKPYSIRFKGLTITGTLDLSGARNRRGGALPSVEFYECTFAGDGVLKLPGSHFEQLSLRKSRFRWLRANGIRVDGKLDLSLVKSADDQPRSIVVPASRSEPEETYYPPELFQHHDREPIEHIEPTVPIHEPDYFEGVASTLHPICWVELRSSQIGVDVDAGGAHLACPGERRGVSGKRFRYFNSPHAWYALDLRGAVIHGRLNISQDDHHTADRVKTDETCFRAIGGVSIIRCRVGASVCGSGSELIALEGNAFGGQRCDVGGHLMLDYSWEGRTNIEFFRANGFIDLTDARIGSCIYMNCARLVKDHHTRAGLSGVGMQVQGNCFFNSTYPHLDAGAADACFSSEGGVTLSRAIIRGDLDLSGATLEANSFGNAVYAPGLTVFGTVNMSVHWREPDPSHHNSVRSYVPFMARGPVVISSSTFHRYLDLRGAVLNSSNMSGLPEINRRRQFNHCALFAEQMHLDGSLMLEPSKCPFIKNDRKDPVFVRAQCNGSVQLARARIGTHLDLRGAILDYGGTRDVLDLTCATIAGNALLCAAWVHGESKRTCTGAVKIEPNAASDKGDFLLVDTGDQGLFFRSRGEIWLNGTEISGSLYMHGAWLRSSNSAFVVQAVNLKVSGFSHMGRFDRRSELRLQSEDAGFDFTNATFTAGLSMQGAIIRGSLQELDATATSTGTGLMRWPALQAKLASIRRLILRDATFTGSLRFKNLVAERGIDADRISVRDGCLDLFNARLGDLNLKQFSLSGMPPSDLDEVTLNYYKAANQSAGSAATGIQPRAVPWRDALRRIWRSRRNKTSKKRTERAAIERSGLIDTIDVVHFGGMKVAGKLVFERTLPTTSSDAGATVQYRMQRGGPVPCFINLRECEVDSLDDQNGAGWGLDMRLRLQGFICHRAPDRKSTEGIFDRAEDEGRDLRTRFYIPYPSIGRFVKRHKGLKGAQPSDAHMAFLNRQYASPRHATVEEFSPSAYDQLAMSLRQGGQEKLADTILSNKLQMRRRVEYGRQGEGTSSFMLSFRFPKRIIFYFFDLLFDHGLSPTRSLFTAACYLLLGAALVSHELGEWHLPFRERFHFIAAHDFLAKLDRSGNIMVTTPGSPVLFADHDSGVAISKLELGEGVKDVECEARRINDVIYAADIMVPWLDLGQEKLCEVSPEHARWRHVQALYVSGGWAIASITLLTLPGVLRKRAEED